MGSSRILLAGGGVETKYALSEAFDDEAFAVDLVHTETIDGTLTELVSRPFQLCVVRGLADAPQFALSICEGAKEAGTRIPVVVLMDLVSRHSENEFLAAGALAAIPWDGSQSAMLRNVMRLTVVLRSTEDNLRKTNDRMVQEMITIQDERERAEALGAQYVELAENYALAKDELEKLNQEKNKFFSIIAHDLRSPFTALLGFTTLLEQRADKMKSDKVKEYAATINQSANRVFKLLENLLEWARIQMDRVEYIPLDFPLSDIAEKTIEVLDSVAQEKRVTLTSPESPLHAYADPNMIDAVIRNLVNNAIKFTPRGGAITLSYDVMADGMVRVNITDTGVGMSANTIDKIFQLAENVSTAGTDGEPGTGLGLLLCKELVARNDGQLYIESTPGEGSTFSFTLPTKAPKTTEHEAAE